MIEDDTVQGLVPSSGNSLKMVLSFSSAHLFVNARSVQKVSSM